MQYATVEATECYKASRLENIHHVARLTTCPMDAEATCKSKATGISKRTKRKRVRLIQLNAPHDSHCAIQIS